MAHWHQHLLQTFEVKLDLPKPKYFLGIFYVAVLNNILITFSSFERNPLMVLNALK